jgi:acyl-CoA thioester hydrolase
MSKHRTPIQLRFSDIDMLKHVNNGKFPTFMETARIAFFNEVVAPKHEWQETGMIVARIELDFKAPIFFHDTLVVETRVSAIGTKSMVFDYDFIVLNDSEQTPKATGKTIMVCYHYTENRSLIVPEDWRTKINLYQETSL